LVNSYVTVYRIVKKSDYLVRIPNCYFSANNNVWRCFNYKIIRKFIDKPNFPLKIYTKSYLAYFTKTNNDLCKAITFAREKFGLEENDIKNISIRQIFKEKAKRIQKEEK
jgi:hypothetical protein